MKAELKQRAILLRRNGFSYSEILKIVPIAKSTLSLWLKFVNLSKSQKQKLTVKKLNAAHRGGMVKRKNRQDLLRKIIDESKTQINPITKNELFLIGTVLYWAEGAKQKETNPSQGIVFSNSDYKMINVFLKWVKECLKTSNEDLVFEIYLHESARARTEKIIAYWTEKTGFCIDKFDRIYYKVDKKGTKRKNIKNNYFGLLRVKVRRSTNLNRQITGWITGICSQCGVV